MGLLYPNGKMPVILDVVSMCFATDTVFISGIE